MPSGILDAVPFCVVGALLLFAVGSIRAAYRYYLRMDRPMAVAVASQVIAVLGTAALASGFFPDSYVPARFFTVVKAFGIKVW